MPYLICNKCNVYYDIEDKSEMNDFHTCECGNELQYFNTMEEYMYGEPENSDIINNDIEESDGKGIFYSVNKKNLVTLQMEMLKENKERAENEHLKRDLNYKINHAMEAAKEKISNSSKKEYEPLIVKEYGENPFKKRKEMLMRTMELLKKFKGE
jgi:hypothetical protein